MPDSKALVHHLLNLIEEIEKLRITAPRQIPDEHFRAHQVELKGLPGIHFNQVRADRDVWLRIDRLDERAPPPPLPNLVEWVVLSKSPMRRPELRASITRAVPDAPPIMVQRADHPDVDDAFAHYLDAVWQPWSVAERPRRTTIGLYRRLFFVHQVIAQGGADRPIELAWGMALASWAPTDDASPLLYPLITQACGLSLDRLRTDTRNFACEILFTEVLNIHARPEA